MAKIDPTKMLAAAGQRCAPDVAIRANAGNWRFHSVRDPGSGAASRRPCRSFRDLLSKESG